MNIFVTGGNSFLGKSFINEALKKKNYIFSLSRKNNKITKVKCLKGDLGDDWTFYLKKTDVVVHLAAEGIKNKKISKKKIFDVNLDKSLKFIKSAINSGCKKYLIISSSSEYGYYSNKLKGINKNFRRYPENNYSLSKAKFTDKIKILSRRNNAKFRVMRVFPLFGESEDKHRLLPSLKNAALNEKDFKLQNPFELRDFTNVKFCAKILLNACNFSHKDKNFEIFHVSSNKPITVLNFAKKYWKKFNAKGKLIFKNQNKIYVKHVSDIRSVWKLKK